MKIATMPVLTPALAPATGHESDAQTEQQETENAEGIKEKKNLQDGSTETDYHVTSSGFHNILRKSLSLSSTICL